MIAININGWSDMCLFLLPLFFPSLWMNPSMSQFSRNIVELRKKKDYCTLLLLLRLLLLLLLLTLNKRKKKKDQFKESKKKKIFFLWVILFPDNFCFLVFKIPNLNQHP